MYYNLHTHKNTHQKDVFELVNQYPYAMDLSVPNYSIGIHPWHIAIEKLDEHLKIIETNSTQKKCLAIGECGLDKRIEIPIEIQTIVLKKQLILAQKHQKPIILHCVKAFQEIIGIKKRMNITVPMIIHGFSQNLEIAQQLINHGFYLSFGKYLLRNPNMENVFTHIPQDKFFLETDTIEEKIQDVYAVAAQYKKKTITEIQEIIKNNFNTVFKNG